MMALPFHCDISQLSSGENHMVLFIWLFYFLFILFYCISFILFEISNQCTFNHDLFKLKFTYYFEGNNSVMGIKKTHMNRFSFIYLDKCD